MSGSNLSMAENFSFTCHEIVTDLNIENIPPYDKNSSIYKLYTKDEFQIETNYFKPITFAIIGGETNGQSLYKNEIEILLQKKEISADKRIKGNGNSTIN